MTISPVRIATAGALSLAVAMGIGRFAFTPILPMMLNDGVVDIAGGSLLATLNYLGYLGGALFCVLLPRLMRGREPSNAVMVRGGLLATVVLTAAMAVPVAGLWPLWRFLSGISSALVFVHTSAWCLARLADGRGAALSGMIYTGPGVGITVSGLAAMAIAAMGGTAAQVWAGFALLAAVLTAGIWRVFGVPRTTAVAGGAAPVREPAAPWSMQQLAHAFAYGLAGFGYIVTATFLPVIAGEVMPGSRWIDFFWPVFGLGVVAGALATRFVPFAMDRRLLLSLCYLTQAAGVVASLLMPNVAGFMVGSALVGVPFTALTLFAMQEARRLRPAGATVFMALLTALYGIGQIVGPPLVALILARTADHQSGFALSLSIASASLVIGGAIFEVSRRRWR